MNDYSDRTPILEMRIQKFIMDETEKMLREVNDTWVEPDARVLNDDDLKLLSAIKDSNMRPAMIPLSDSVFTPGQPDIKIK